MAEDYEVVAVDATLQVTLFVNGNARTDTVVSGDLTVPVIDDHIVCRDVLDELVRKMDTIARHHAAGRTYMWMLYIAYEGRCWYIDPSVTDKPYDIGYLIFDKVGDILSVLT